jgi:hypothetical protein
MSRTARPRVAGSSVNQTRRPRTAWRVGPAARRAGAPRSGCGASWRRLAFAASAPRSAAMQPYPPDFLLDRLLYRDGLILVVDKPAGLPVHAGPKGGPNLEDYVDALRFGLPNPPHLAHRLDRDTSGCLVLGRHKKALRRLGKLFESGQVEKVYWAVVEGPRRTRGGSTSPCASARPRHAAGGWSRRPRARASGRSPTTGCWPRRRIAASWNAGRGPAGRTSSACTWPASATRSGAIWSMARRDPARACCSTPRR